MKKVLSGMLAAAALLGCAGGKEKAEAPAAGAYALDAEKSSLSAVAMKNEAVPVTLRFPKLSGSLAIGEAVSGEVSTEVAALETGDKARDMNVRELFFEASQAVFKSATFKLKSLEGGLPDLKEGQSWPLKASGTLSLHGADLALSGPLTVSRTAKGYEASFKDTWLLNIEAAGMLDRLKVLNEKCPQPHRVGLDVKLSGNLVFKKKG